MGQLDYKPGISEMKLSGILATFAFLAIAAGAPPASAHSFPQQEIPSAGQKLAKPPSEVSIRFDAPIEKLFAKLDVVDSSGSSVTAGPPEIGPKSLTLSVKLAALKPGDYTVKWGVVCLDSHHTQGSYTFSITGSAG
jgi:methionine-rich copper-binding protein CopC